jgi:hypothetical protein
MIKKNWRWGGNPALEGIGADKKHRPLNPDAPVKVAGR